jgi:hypothetical protein
MDAQSPSDVVLPPMMRAGGEMSREAARALCRHPGFAAAMRAVLSDNVGLYRGNPILDSVGNYCCCPFCSALISLNLASAHSNFSLNSHIASRISR